MNTDDIKETVEEKGLDSGGFREGFSESVHASSKKLDWETPLELFKTLNKAFSFTLDAAANLQNAKCDCFISEQEDALSTSWVDSNKLGGWIWINPPYGGGLAEWTHQIKRNWQSGASIVALLPARTDTRYWHNDIFPHMCECLSLTPQYLTPEMLKEGVTVNFLPGRLKFVGAEHSAPFPSALIFFKAIR